MIETAPGGLRASGDAPRAGLSPLLFLGVAVASLGGPLALVALLIPTISVRPSPLGWMTIAGTVLFAFPLLIWYRYARRVSGSGGLYSFVEEAAGLWPARVQGAIWIVSYGLYVVYTVPDVVYDVLPAILPGVAPWQPWLEVGLPIVIAAVAVLPIRFAAGALTVAAALQVLLVLALAGAGVAHLGAPRPALLADGLPSLATGTAQISLLYICGGLPVFLGGEVRNPLRTVPRGLVIAFCGVGALTVAAILILVGTGLPTGSASPGVDRAADFGGRALALGVGLGIALSSLCLILVELLAVIRVLRAMAGVALRPASIALGLIMIGGCALTLIDPLGAYRLLTRPSLIALWLSQLIVFAAYPAFARRGRRLGPLDVTATVLACALTLFGLLSAAFLPAWS